MALQYIKVNHDEYAVSEERLLMPAHCIIDKHAGSNSQPSRPTLIVVTMFPTTISIISLACMPAAR